MFFEVVEKGGDGAGSVKGSRQLRPRFSVLQFNLHLPNFLICDECERGCHSFSSPSLDLSAFITGFSIVSTV